ncbi:ArsR/SmtB family transcription factor [Sinimarinibacterium sp. CAU 1509]|uniref:ArsR/SmtB family transcription factor n=1 Tax=Sinimarinibacterium sp. CAU 1509 TaxID=2562283 RepID=UPI003F904126
MVSRRSQQAEQSSSLDPDEMAQHAGRAAHLLKTLGNEHRLMILCALSEGETSVRVLNERVPLSQSALSQHLAVLREDGLVQTRREAQTIYYSVIDGPALQVVRLVHDLYCCGARR